MLALYTSWQSEVQMRVCLKALSVYQRSSADAFICRSSGETVKTV